jgi:hypothetical protein
MAGQSRNSLETISGQHRMSDPVNGVHARHLIDPDAGMAVPAAPEALAARVASFTRLTGRPQEPLQRVEEFFGVIGRRGGKTRASAALAVYVAALCDHAGLAAGERGLVLCLAQNQRTAAVAFGYAAAIFESQPLLAGLARGRTQDTLSLSTGVDLEIRPASFRGLRGLTAVGAAAFRSRWRSADLGGAGRVAGLQSELAAIRRGSCHGARCSGGECRVSRPVPG